MARPTAKKTLCDGFTLIEMLLVVAVIGIMSALVVAAISNAGQDSRKIIARQQQVVVQEALNSWVAAQSSITVARQSYSNSATALAKINLISNYLDPGTYEHFTNNTTDASKVQSDALTKSGRYLQFRTWDASGYPKVDMVEQ